MRKTLLLGATLLQLGLAQDIKAQTTTNLEDNLSGNYKKEILLDPSFLTAPLDTVINKITTHQYDHYTYRQIIKSLLLNHDIQEKIALYQLNNPNTYRASSDNFFHQTQIIKTIFLEKGFALWASSEYGFATAPILSVTTTSGKDPYIQDLLPNTPQYDNITLYHVYDPTSQMVATPVGNAILFNDYLAALQYKDVIVSHPELTLEHNYQNFVESLYANEKLHIYEGMTYGDHMTNKDTVDCDGVSYTRREISEMRSDYISLEHDPRYIYAIIQNMVYDDVANPDIKENTIQAKYGLSQHILKTALQKEGYILSKRGEKYFLYGTTYAMLSESSESGIANHIYQKLSIADIEKIIDVYRQQALIYKGYLDMAYKDKKNNAPK